jgi:hypothetical protein
MAGATYARGRRGGLRLDGGAMMPTKMLASQWGRRRRRRRRRSLSFLER